MRALSLSQPWAWCVVHHAKRIENRPLALAAVARSICGQRVALHAAQSWDGAAQLRLRAAGVPVPMQVGLDRGALIGVATVHDVVIYSHEGERARIPEGQEAWASGPVCLVLDDVRSLAKPIPLRGQLGFWYLAADVEAAVLEQLGEAAAS